jgi:hypothetical protein
LRQMSRWAHKAECWALHRLITTTPTTAAGLRALVNYLADPGKTARILGGEDVAALVASLATAVNRMAA